MSASKIKLDKIDKEILMMLSKNARLSARQIAKKLGISAVTVVKRLRKLEKEVIKGYAPILDYEILGYDVNVVIKAQIEMGESLLSFPKKIRNHPNVIFAQAVAGDFDLVILAAFKSRKEVSQFLIELQKEAHITRTETMFILDELQLKQIEVK